MGSEYFDLLQGTLTTYQLKAVESARGGRIQTALGLFVPCGLRAGALVANCFAIGRTTSMMLIRPWAPYTKKPR